MHRSILGSALLLALATAAQAAPRIDAILNAAAYTLPGLPNYGIAPGSMFVVFGTELGPAGLQQAAGLPLPATLGGTSMRVTVGAASVDAIMVYTSATQAAAILPSTTPLGIGLLSVTYQGRTSQSGAFRILRSAPGLLAQNQAGTGPALAQNFNSAADQPRNGLTRAAHPGQVVTLWATGLGPISGSDSVAPAQQDLNLNLQVLVGGQSAPVRYKGRSGCCAGVDQIVIQIPPGVAGCYVPVVVRVDDFVSNFTSLSITSAGDVCTDLNGVSGADLEKLLAGGTLATASIGLYLESACDDFVCVPGNPPSLVEGGRASFSRSGLPIFGPSRPGLPSPGSCSVLASSGFLAGYFVKDDVPLDAGSVLNLSGPRGTRQLGLFAPGFYFSEFSRGASQVRFLEPGDYVLDNGVGGTDVGPFRATLTIPKTLSSTVQRSVAGVKITWTGGNPSGMVVIEGTAAPGLSGVIPRFTCAERVSAGQFTLPAEVLLSLPPDSADHAGLTLSASSPAVTVFRARGLDLGQISFSSILP